MFTPASCRINVQPMSWPKTIESISGNEIVMKRGVCACKWDGSSMADGIIDGGWERNSEKWGDVLEEIVRIEKRVFPKHESLAKSFEQELRKNNCGLLYTEVGGDIAGYVMYSWPSSLCASITKLAVKEKYRKQGHGEALLKAAIDKCRTRNIHRISLHADPSRVPAVNLYKKFGFLVDTLVRGYYSSDRDAYRMHLDFDAD